MVLLYTGTSLVEERVLGSVNFFFTAPQYLIREGKGRSALGVLVLSQQWFEETKSGTVQESMAQSPGDWDSSAQTLETTLNLSISCNRPTVALGH